MKAPDRILKRARTGGRGSVFTAADFLDMASRAAVDQALSRLAKDGRLRRPAPVLHDFPNVHPKLGPLSPGTDDVARALARETGSRFQIAGARAANVLFDRWSVGASCSASEPSTYGTLRPST